MLLGVETEYGVAVLGSPAGSREKLLEDLISLAKSALCCLPETGGPGIFSENSSRLYPEVGGHFEIATPECSDPFQAVRYVLAGDRILASLVADLERETGVSGITIWRSNVDYLTGATWGAHENFLNRRSSAQVYAALAAFLASRICYAGAGGFRPGVAGLQFLLSPRVAYIERDGAETMMPERPLVHDKNEPLGFGYRRLHLVCGESLCSELAYVLKLGATALVVAAIDAGVLDERPLRLRRPEAAMFLFAKDPSLRVEAPVVGGKAMTAIEIQRWYLERVREHLGADWMPSWAGRVCEYWGDTLDRLEQGPDAVATRLDWAIKLAMLFRPRLEHRGFDERSVRAYSAAARMRRPGPTGAASVLDDDEIFALSERALAAFPSEGGFRARSRTDVEKYLKAQGLSASGLRRFDRVRHELFEIDACFPQITGDGSIFGDLDAAGMLDHRVPEVGDVGAAMFEPPPGGRAARRSEYIRKLYRVPGSSCTWTFVRDGGNGGGVDLSDPFGVQAVEVPPGAPRPRRPRPSPAEALWRALQQDRVRR
jgi:proteasome accessory factor A